MPRIKITQPGWEGFTGDIGQTAFVDGVSVEAPTQRQVAVIGASLSLVVVDSDGVEGDDPRLQHTMIAETASRIAPMLATLARATEKDVTATAIPAAADPASYVFHTKDDLEAVASAKGIAGLREISDALGLKVRSINEAIKVILKAELKLKAALEAAGHVTTPAPAAAAAEEAAEEAAEKTKEESSEGDDEAKEGSSEAKEGSSDDADASKEGSSEQPEVPAQPDAQESQAKRSDAGPGADESKDA